MTEEREHRGNGIGLDSSVLLTPIERVEVSVQNGVGHQSDDGAVRIRRHVEEIPGTPDGAGQDPNDNRHHEDHLYDV